MADGPWNYDQVAPLIDFSGQAEWHGGTEPEPIEAGCCPGGLIARQLGSDGVEHRRWALHLDTIQSDVTEAIMALKDIPGSFVAVHDGDTGRAIVTLITPHP